MRRAVGGRRAGMMVVELIIATGLTALLLMLLATTWATFGRPALEVDARARIEQEGILAAQSLACDFGGFLADSPGRIGTIQVGVASPPPPSSTPFWNASNPGVLLLNFYGATTSEVIVIRYELIANSQGVNQLVRTNSSTGVATTVASYVTAFSAAANPSDATQVVITLTIAYRNFATTFTLIGVPPST
jgi:hypothetical protein